MQKSCRLLITFGMVASFFADIIQYDKIHMRIDISNKHVPAREIEIILCNTSD